MRDCGIHRAYSFLVVWKQTYLTLSSIHATIPFTRYPVTLKYLCSFMRRYGKDFQIKFTLRKCIENQNYETEKKINIRGFSQ